MKCEQAGSSNGIVRQDPGAGSSPAVSAEGAMSFFNKIRNRSRITRGRAKQKVGRATNNRRLQADGLADRIAGNARQFGEELKDAGKDIRRTLER
jgi:uncharacterized protein YjbJ (UPF0337 family)